MRIRKPRGRREQPSLRPPLLQSAQGSEKHEDEVDMGDAELLIGFSHAAWDQYDAQRNSTAPSTESEELPEMEAGREVVVRSVNPSLQGQDGEERVTSSMAKSLEVNRDVGMKKQGEEAEELTGPAALAAVALEELKGRSNMFPVLIEESESDSELPPSVDPSEALESESNSELPSSVDPFKAPEGSLLRVLHLQLSGGGITVRELFKCLEEPAEVLRFGVDWKVQVRRHLKTNPHFCEAKGLHYLKEQQPKPSPANIASSSHRYGASSSKTVLSSQHSTPAPVQTGLSVDTREGGGRTQRKAFQKAEKAIAIAAMSEQAAELEEMHQSMADMQMLSLVADRTDSQLVSHGPLVTSCRKRKSSLSDEKELPYHGHPILSGLQATQAEILAKKEVQMGHRNASQSADAQQGKQAATSLQHNHDVSSIMGLPESHTNLALDLSSLSLHPKSATISREDTPRQTEAAKNVDKPATGVSNHDDDSDGEQSQQQKPKDVPKRRHVAARKTAANVGALKPQGPEIRTPTTPPLPPPYGIRRKTPVKNRLQ